MQHISALTSVFCAIGCVRIPEAQNMTATDETLTRRQIIQRLAFAATATAVVRVPDVLDAQQADANAKVRATLESLVKEGPEIGRQVAAYLNGKLAIDAWAGLADPRAKKPVDGDTMFMLSSTTKGVTATCLHILVEKHKLDY